MKTFGTRVIWLLWVASVASGQTRKPEDLIRQLAQDPNDEKTVRALTGRSEPEVGEALVLAFDSTANAENKRVIAFSLVFHGRKDDKYFDYLALLARVAIEDNAPNIFLYDASGAEVKGRINPEFNRWCEGQGIDLTSCSKNHLWVYVEDVTRLVMLADSRSAELLLRGISSRNVPVAAACAAGLGLIHREDALPLIFQRLGGLPASAASHMAKSLAEFSSPDAETVLARYFPDGEQRRRLREQSLYRLPNADVGGRR